MNPEDRKYTKEHEWVLLDGDVATIGITHFAQEQLTDVVFVELPEVGASLDAGKSAAAVESVKSVSDIYAPIAGEIVAANEELTDNPQLINEDPYGKGWVYKLKVTDTAAVEAMLTATQYEEFIKNEAH